MSEQHEWHSGGLIDAIDARCVYCGAIRLRLHDTFVVYVPEVPLFEGLNPHLRSLRQTEMSPWELRQRGL